MDFVAFPTCLKQHVLLFCNVKDLVRCCELSQSFNVHVKNAAKTILSAIAAKYYDDFPQKEQWLASEPPFALLKEVLEQKTYVLRGFALYALNMRTLTWKRCSDCARDRLQAALEFKGGFLYAIGTESVVAHGTVEKYNPLTDRWVAVHPFPSDLPERITTVTHNEKIYVFGGIRFSDVYVLCSADTGAETWQRLEVQLPQSLLFPHTVSFKGRVWIIGSTQSWKIGTHIYDTDAGTFVPGPSAPDVKLIVGAFVADDNIYVLCSDWEKSSWMKCSGENGPWEVVGQAPLDTNIRYCAAHNDRVTCFYPGGVQCDAYSLTEGKWDSEIAAATASDGIGAGAGDEHDATHIAVPPEVHIDSQCSVIGYSPRAFTWG